VSPPYTPHLGPYQPETHGPNPVPDEPETRSNEGLYLMPMDFCFALGWRVMNKKIDKRVWGGHLLDVFGIRVLVLPKQYILRSWFYGLGFSVWGLRFQVQGLRLRVQGLVYRVQGLG